MKPALNSLKPLRLPALLAIGMLHLTGPAGALTYIWTGEHDSNWNDGRNWSPAGIPSDGDSVIVNGGSVDYGGSTQNLATVTVNGGHMANVGALTAQHAVLNGGTLSAASLTVQTLDLGGGTLAAPCQVAAGGTWSSGWINAATEITATADVSLPSGEVWLGGSVTLTNRGLVRMTGGRLGGYDASVVHNHGTWRLLGHSDPFPNYYGGNVFHNHGLLNKTGGTDPTQLANQWSFKLGGETRCETGELRFVADTELLPGANLTGNGTIRSTGQLYLTAPVTETAANLILDGALHASGTAAINGTLEWASGSINGTLTVPAASGMLVTGAGFRRLGGSSKIDNFGHVTWQATSPVEGYDASTIHNRTGATFEIAGDGLPLSAYYGGHVFQNDGLLRKSAGGGTAELNYWTIHQSGTIQCDSGFIELRPLTYLHDGSVLSGLGGVVFNGDIRMDGNVQENLAILRMTGGSLSCADPCSLTGRLEWLGGGIYGVLNVPAGSMLQVAGADFKRLGGGAQLKIAGTYRWEGPAGIEGYENSIIAIQGGAVCDLAADGDPFHSYYGGNELVNEGLLRKTAGGGGVTLLNDWTFRNRGETRCDVSTLEFASVLSLEATSSITGPGQVIVHETIQHSGTVNITAPCAWTSGSWTGSSGIMTGGITWQGGTSYGTWKLTSGTLRVEQSAVPKGLGGAALIEVGGTFQFVSGGINGYENSIVRILSGGQFQCTGPAFMDNYYGGNRLQLMAGSNFTTGGACDLRIDWALDNHGTLKVPAGIVQANGNGGTSSGAFEAVSPGTLHFTYGTHTLATGSEIRGPGEVKVTGGALVATGLVPALVHVAGGTVHGEGPGGEFQFRHGSQWTSGYLGGHTRVLPGATLTVSGAPEALRRMNGSAWLDIDGRLLWQGPGAIELYESCHLEIPAAGIMEITGDGEVFTNYYGGHSLTNHGTIRRSGSAGQAMLSRASYASNGIIDVATGRLSLHSPFALDHGSSIRGAGRLAIAENRTTLTGTATLAPASVVEINGGELYGTPASSATILAGGVEWIAGWVSGNVTWNGVARIGGPGLRRIGGSSELNNAGYLTLEPSGETQAYEYSILRNLQGATMKIAGQTHITTYYGGNQVINEGTLVLGSSPGRVTLNPAFVQTTTGRLEVGIAGPSEATPDFDILNVNNVAYIAGTLIARLENGYKPPVATGFQILTASTRVGFFEHEDTPSFNVYYPVHGDPPVSDNNVVLSSTASGLDYATWAFNKNLSGPDALATSDPEHDGSENLVEYAFNMEPKQPDVQPLARAIETIGGQRWLVLRYRRWNDRVDAGLQYLPEWSSNLSAWSTTGLVDEFDTTAPAVTGSEPRRCRIPAEGNRNFLHIRLVAP